MISLCGGAPGLQAQDLVVKGHTVYTMAGQPITNGAVVIREGKIAALGRASEVTIPADSKILEAQVVLPGLVDARQRRRIVGLSESTAGPGSTGGLRSHATRAARLDAYNGRDELVAWLRSFGVTTLHTGHAPGELISGQTMVVKTAGNSVEDAVLVPSRAVACTLASLAAKSGGKSPGTRGKMMAMLRSRLLQAREYQTKLAAATESTEQPPRNLDLEALVSVLDGKTALLVTADRAQDISNALRLAAEFKLPLWLDSAAEAYLLVDEIQAANVPVLIHPSMARAIGDRENLSFETAGKLAQAGITVAFQSGFESYVPKTRVVLFEAAIAAANGMPREQAMAAMTIVPARILGVADRVGSLEIGKDGDLALYVWRPV